MKHYISYLIPPGTHWYHLRLCKCFPKNIFRCTNTNVHINRYVNIEDDVTDR